MQILQIKSTFFFRLFNKVYLECTNEGKYLFNAFNLKKYILK